MTTHAKNSAMPPTKQAKQKAGLEQVRINELYAKNLDEMIRWYRRMPSGPDLGSNVVVEMVLRDVVHAWTLALQGKNWQPPAASP